jgi:intraflagellar transport protein 140
MSMWVTGQEQTGQYEKCAIHNAHGILAVASNEGSISLFNEELECLQTMNQKKDSAANLLAWHPSKKILAMTLDTVVGLWCVEHDGVLREGNAHQSKVEIIKWSPSGHRLITGDNEGVVIVWKVENKGRISAISQYRLKSAATSITFKSAGMNQREQRSKENFTMFIAVKESAIYYADDAGHCNELMNMPASIISLRFRDIKDELLVVTDDLALTDFKLTPDGKLNIGNPVKLGGGMKTKGCSIFIEWTNADQLVWSINGGSPRIWDVDVEDTQVLDGAEMGVNQYKCLTYNKKNDLISAATQSGNVVLWQLAAATGTNATAERKWEVL